MPPAISDEEASDNELTVPLTSVTKRERERKSASYKEDEMEEDNANDQTNGQESEHDDDEEGDDGEEDEELEEYVVEKIISHQFQGGELKFEVKWEGYEKKADRTWEPEDNLKDNASVILEEYFEAVGGRDKIFQEMKNGLKGKKRGRSSTNTPTMGNKRSRKNGDHPKDTSPPATAKRAAWKPPAGSWEEDIASLDACEDEEKGKLMVYLTWKNGHRTQHETSVIYKRCPQKMLQFYERHVRIIKKDQDDALAAASPID
ncbi:hypothetical protein QBC33DRAFT_54604 [Phialemonium atrogriseum]|uniref:Chromo domain-containing protein n=1 Tax=Phialemonium atrogriseum TaxID=1093897 RepID=A0AAJ0FLU1_9PEZI|nr:uncharacterized protein QBC33DRAFT_54604 [Phialemonium atrogriseum]KAK1767698.1 hypothetical protein QBC33DRAFT_54604 [Phialemonium atrogriseum]